MQADRCDINTLIKATSWGLLYSKKCCLKMKHSVFLDHVRVLIRTNQFSYSTEKTHLI